MTGTSVYVKHKSHFLILPSITTPISAFPPCPYSFHSVETKERHGYLISFINCEPFYLNLSNHPQASKRSSRLFRTFQSQPHPSNNCNIIGSFDNTVIKSDEDMRILCWLSPLEPTNRHHDMRTERIDGVGGWVLETREFRWRGSENGTVSEVLFCSGNPGVGKTYLSYVVGFFGRGQCH